MGEKEPEKKNWGEIRRDKTNPLSPKYTVAAGTGTKQIGEISGQRPKKIYKPLKKLAPEDNLSACTNTNIEWKLCPEKYKPRISQVRPTAGAQS